MPRQKSNSSNCSDEDNFMNDNDEDSFLGDNEEDSVLNDNEEDSMVNDKEEFLDDDSNLDNENTGNVAWADAMSKVLNTKISQKKFILSKARKDSDIVKKAQQKQEIELIDESGNVKKSNEIPKVKSYKALRKEMLEKQKQVRHLCIIYVGI